MPAEPRNCIFFLSDEHNRKIAGCYGHPFVKTPNLDKLAGGGTRFESAYCNSPICVPSRASLATGRYVHDIGYWDNASPYAGHPASWHAILRDAGVDVISIGKLHFRGGDDNGFTDEILPLHVVDGRGDLKGLFRKELPPKYGTGDMANQAGRGTSSYWEYDERIADAASAWLKARAVSAQSSCFTLFVSFVMPHFPLIAKDEYCDLYSGLSLSELTHRLDAPPPDHPTLNRMANYFDYDRHFNDERRAAALVAYYGMVTRLDELIGSVMTTLEAYGFKETTDIIYASDHGDNLGNRGMWGKSVMYEDSVGVPMILSGAGIPSGKVVETPVSLLDIAPTIAEMTGVEVSTADFEGESLVTIANDPPDNRVVMAEYHAAGSDTGQFMIRRNRWKYVVYVGKPPQLFDLESDPDELDDVSTRGEAADILAQLDADLRSICDPEEVSDRAFADQQRLIEANGGREQIEKSVDIPFTPAPAN